MITFKINENEGISSDELSMLDDNLIVKPNGLDRFHVFKDKKDENKYYLIEYWQSKDFYHKMENSSDYSQFQRIHKISKKKDFNNIECDVLI